MAKDSHLRNYLEVYSLSSDQVYDQNVRGEGMVDGEGSSSERCLKWGGGGN